MNIQKLKQSIIHLCSYKKPTIILGLSGGPDSVFLFHILKDMHHKGAIELIAVHLNHEWRETAAHDEEFVKNLCERFSIPCVLKKAYEIKNYRKSKGSKEEHGRNLRRAFFEKVAQEHAAHAIALAHHADDQMETFLLRLIRGATLDGLCGIKAKEGLYIRPLLSLHKHDITIYLEKKKLEYCLDETNESDDFLRNRIRKTLIPSFNSIDNRFMKTFFATHNHLCEENKLLHIVTEEKYKEIFKDKGSLPLFQKCHPVLQKRLLLQWFITEKVPFTSSQSFFEECLRFINSKEGGSHKVSPSWEIIKKEKALSIKKY